MAENTFFDQLNTNVDSYETKVYNSTAVNSFQSIGPNGEIIFDSTQQSLPGFIADTASLKAASPLLVASGYSRLANPFRNELFEKPNFLSFLMPSPKTKLGRSTNTNIIGRIIRFMIG